MVYLVTDSAPTSVRIYRGARDDTAGESAIWTGTSDDGLGSRPASRGVVHRTAGHVIRFMNLCLPESPSRRILKRRRSAYHRTSPASPLRNQPCTQLARFSVGMVVEFETEDGRTLSGTVARLNQRTATVVTHQAVGESARGFCGRRPPRRILRIDRSALLHGDGAKGSECSAQIQVLPEVFNCCNENGPFNKYNTSYCHRCLHTSSTAAPPDLTFRACRIWRAF